MAININTAINRINQILNPLLGFSPSIPITAQSSHGKVYEFLVLFEFLSVLQRNEGANIYLQNSNLPLTCNLNPGQIHRNHNFINLRLPSNQHFEVHLNIEFLTISSTTQYNGNGNLSDLHELDIAVIFPGCTRHPSYDQIVIGIECKDTTVNKGHIRNMLGLRRELSYLNSPQTNYFTSQGLQVSNSNPPSLLLFYCSDAKVTNYEKSGIQFDIKYICLN